MNAAAITLLKGRIDSDRTYIHYIDPATLYHTSWSEGTGVVMARQLCSKARLSFHTTRLTDEVATCSKCIRKAQKA